MRSCWSRVGPSPNMTPVLVREDSHPGEEGHEDAPKDGQPHRKLQGQGRSPPPVPREHGPAMPPLRPLASRAGRTPLPCVSPRFVLLCSDSPRTLTQQVRAACPALASLADQDGFPITVSRKTASSRCGFQSASRQGLNLQVSASGLRNMGSPGPTSFRDGL